MNHTNRLNLPIALCSLGTLAFSGAVRAQVPTLPNIVVNSSLPTDYNAQNAISATRTDTPILETPFAVEVVTQQTMQDQQSMRIQDAILGNVSSVSANANGYSDNTNFTIRGFSTGPNVYQDGLLLPYSMNVDTANMQSIEVLKGPAAALYGRMPPGGLVNYTTRQPLDAPYHEVQQTVGSYGTARTSVDLTGPVDDARTVMYRLDADYTKANSFVHFENARNALFAPSLTYRPTDRFQITVQGEYQNVRNVDSDPNFPAIGNRPAPIPTSSYLEDPGVTVPHPDTMEKKFFAYHWSFKLNDDWQITNRLAYNDLPEHVTNMYFASVSGAGAGVNSLQYGPAGVKTFTTNMELAGKFSTGGAMHQVLVGGDHLNFTEYFNGIYDYAAQNIDIFNPQASYNTVSLASALDPANGNGFALLSKQRWNGVYAQDMIHLPDANLRVLVGGRYDWSNTGSGIGFGNAAWSGAISGFQQATDGGFSPRVGVSLDLSPSMAAYANYSKALGLSNVSTGVTVTGQPLSPQWSMQKEIGLKGEFLNGRLSASTAYYDITLNDIPAAVPNTFGVFYLIGQARSRGFELDVTGKVNDSLSLIATLTHDLATVVSGYTTNFVDVPAGNRLPSVPENMGSLWLKYSSEAGLQAWRVACGVTVVDQTQGDPANDFQISGYAVVRAMAGYDFRLGNSKATVQLNVDNLLNRTFFYGSTAYGNAYSLTPGTPRSVLGTVKLQF